jgi:DNA-binding NarL/FixJ family response regulator
VATPLSEEEGRVLRSLARGRTGTEIAVELDISEEDVRTAVQSILIKLQVHSRLEEATRRKGGKAVAPQPCGPGARGSKTKGMS